MYFLPKCRRESAVSCGIVKSLLTLAFPAILEQVLSTLLQYVDTAMVGRLSEKAIVAVSVTQTVNWLIGSVFFACGTAMLALISHNLGSRNYEKLKTLARHAVLFAVILGVLIGIIALALSPFIPVWMGAEKDVAGQASTYFFIISLPMIFRSVSVVLGCSLRAVKDTKTPMFVNVAQNILNVVLNYIFIYILNLGVTGAAIATAISFTCAALMMFAAFCKNKLFCFKTSEFKSQTGLYGARHSDTFDSAIIHETLKIGLPLLASNVASCLGYVCFAALVSSMGTYIFAAQSIAVTAETLFYIPGYGLRTASSTLTGIALGKKDRAELVSVEKISVILTLSAMFVSGALLYIFAMPLMSVFSSSERVILLGGKMLRLVAFSEPFFGLMVVFEGIYYGLGRTKYPFYIETFSMWGIRILFTFLCVKVWHLDLSAVWYCMIADNVFKASLLSVPALFPSLRKKMLLF